MAKQVQNQYIPDYAVPPGETLLETIQTLGMAQAEFAAATIAPLGVVTDTETWASANGFPPYATEIPKTTVIPAWQGVSEIVPSCRSQSISGPDTCRLSALTFCTTDKNPARKIMETMIQETVDL